MIENSYGFICGKISARDLSVEETKKLCRKYGVSYKKLLDYIFENINNLPISFRDKFIIKNEFTKKEEKVHGVKALFKNEKELENACKYVFDYCQDKGKVVGCKELASKQNISFKKVCEAFDIYAVRHGDENFKSEMLQRAYKKEVVFSDYELEAFKFFEKILSIPVTEYDNLVEAFNNTTYDLKDSSLLAYVFSKKYENEEEIILNILERTSVLRGYLIRKQRNSVEYQEKINIQNIKLANEVIYCFVKSGLSLNYFCELMNIDYKKIISFSEIVKETNEDLYNSFKEICEYEENKSFIEIKKLLEILKTGEEFSIIDYFENINLRYEELGNYLTRLKNELTNEEINIIRRFMRYNTSAMNDSKSFRKAIFNERYFYNASFNNNSSIELTNNEKEKLIEYLSNRYIPVNRITFNLVLKKYLRGQLSFDNELERTL